jgi:hypothetical protein
MPGLSHGAEFQRTVVKMPGRMAGGSSRTTTRTYIGARLTFRANPHTATRSRGLGSWRPDTDRGFMSIQSRSSRLLLLDNGFNLIQESVLALTLPHGGVLL